MCLSVTGSKEHNRQEYRVSGVTMARGVIRCGEHESGVQTPRNLIGRPGTNGNRADRNQALLNNLDAGKMNPGPKNFATTNAVQEYLLFEI